LAVVYRRLGIILLAIAPWARAQTLTDRSLTVTEIVSGLSAPIQFSFLGTNDLLVLEKNSGQVRRVLDGVLQPTPVLDVAVDNSSERGLLGLALHPGFATNHFVYLCYTESSTGSDTGGVDPQCICIYRYEWTGSALANATPIYQFSIQPGVGNHNGGVITFGPDDKLYAVTGDHNRSGQLQNHPGGPAPDDTSVIVRLNDDGAAPNDNPFFSQSGMTNVFAYGVRNSFGIVFDPVNGNLWDTENGPNSYDEINLVLPGFNSGWREIQGPAARSAGSTNNLFVVTGSHYTEPRFSWLTTVAPTALAFLNSSVLGAQYENDLFVGDFNNGLLYRFSLNPARTDLVLSGTLADKVADTAGERQAVEFGSGFGAISDLKVGLDGRLYVVSIGLGKVFAIGPAVIAHDLAVLSVKPPKRVTLSGTRTNQTKNVKITLKNLGNQTETIPDEATLTNVVGFIVESLGACPEPAMQLVPPKKGYPIVWAPKKKLRLSVNLTFNCANDEQRGTGHEDFRYQVIVNQAALGSGTDSAPANDVCPRDPNGADKGCGSKDPVTKRLGADVFTDIIVP
jgi:aldose sugar dehydrogenase